MGGQNIQEKLNKEWDFLEWKTFCVRRNRCQWSSS